MKILLAEKSWSLTLKFNPSQLKIEESSKLSSTSNNETYCQNSKASWSVYWV